MKFWGKTARMAAITIMIGGGIISVTGAIILGVGCNATIKYQNNDLSGRLGVGATNFETLWTANSQTTLEISDLSYWSFINECKKNQNKLQDELNYLKNANAPASEISSLENNLNTLKQIISGSDQTIAGAILFPVFILVVGVGLAILLTNIKKTKQNKKQEDELNSHNR